MKNILKIEKMGMNIIKGDLTTDLTNYRYYIHLDQDNVLPEFKKAYTIDTIEIMRGYKHEIKNNKINKVADNMLAISIYKYDENGNCWGDLNLEKALVANDKRFNKKDLLEAINKLVINKYEELEEI